MTCILTELTNTNKTELTNVLNLIKSGFDHIFRT